MGDVDDCVCGKRERQDGQRLTRIAYERRRSNQEEADCNREIRADSRLRLVAHGEADVGAADERQQECGDLRQAEFGDEPFGRRDWDECRLDRLPREAGGKGDECDESGTKRFRQQRGSTYIKL